MAHENWQQVKKIFADALRQTPEARPQFLDSVCSGDNILRSEVESLLTSFDSAESFMETPAVGEVAGSFTGKEILREGICFGHYEIIKQIGIGGMGEVYLANDKKLDRKVAVKILNEKFSRHESNLERFTREAKAASSLNHPNILVIHEIGEADKAHYIVSEYIEGKTLREFFKEKSLDLNEILDISIQIANALSVAHEARLIHRDIKPENIMIRPDGLVKILDFGLAKLIIPTAFGFQETTVRQNDTAQGVIMGTVNYMSPEQAKGEKVDERTDIFSLGVMIYEMLAGRTPFAGDSMPEAFANLINGEPLMLSHYAEDVPDNLQKIVFKTLNKNKAARYQTMKELLVDLKGLRENLVFSELLGKKFPLENKTAVESFQSTTGDANRQTADTQPVLSSRIKLHKSYSTFFLATLLIGAACFGYYFLSLRKNVSGANGKRSIAVLPFVNVSQDLNAEYLSDGITESVINNLSQLSGLKVMAKDSVFRYKNKEIELKKAADELGVQTLVTGDVRQSGDKIIINIHLIDPDDGTQIWGTQFIRNSSELISTQNEMTQLVVQNLQLNLTDEEKQKIGKHPTDNAEAYQLYLKGRFIAQLNTPEALNKSIEFYQQAIVKDRNFALAYSEIGMRYVNLGIYFAPPRQMMPNARIYADKALEIDNTLSDPHVVLGLVALLYDWDWDKAKDELSQGNEVSLQSIETFNCTAHVLQITGRAADADEPLHRALDNDPLSISLNTELGCNSYYARRYDESISEYHEALSIEPHNFMAIYGLARSLNHKKQYQEAIAEIEKAKTFMPMLPPIAVAEEGYAYAQMGSREEAEAQLKRLDDTSKKIFVDPFFMATVYLSLDDKDQTLAWLEKAFDAKSSLIPTIINDIKWDDLREDTRFQSLLRRIGSPV